MYSSAAEDDLLDDAEITQASQVTCFAAERKTQYCSRVEESAVLLTVHCTLQEL